MERSLASPSAYQALTPAARPASSTVLRTVGAFLITSLKQPNKVLVVGPDFLGDVIAWNRSCTRCCGIEVALLSGRFGGHDRRSSLVRFIAHARCSSDRPFSRNVGSVPASASVPFAPVARPAHRIRPAVGRKVLALLAAALKRRCRAMALDIDAVLDAEY